MMRRREFIALLGGAATWPLAAQAQQRVRMQRVGVLVPYAVSDPEGQSRVTVFQRGLKELGWTEGGNVQIEVRWTAGDADRMRVYATELVALSPDVIMAIGLTPVLALRQASHTIPIVFTAVADPVSGGVIESLARPGGNTTGFSNMEFGTGAKWLELLKQIAPHVMRVAIVRENIPTGIGLFAVIQERAPSFGIEAIPITVQDAGEIERGIAAFARSSNAGLIVAPNAVTVVHRELIMALAAQHRLPTVYPIRLFATTGGLISYGPDLVDQCHRAAGYVDRILKGEKPADLPVQAPTKYELVINLKTAKALGLIVPDTLLARADEVIE